MDTQECLSYFVEKDMKLITMFLTAGLAASLSGLAQMKDNQEPTLTCNDHNNRNGRLIGHCEMREQTMASSGLVNVDGHQNGGVSIKGWSRPDVLVRAQIQTSAETEAEAQSLATQVQLSAAGGRIGANGPEQSRRQNWSVSYEVFVPHHSNIELTTHNGGVSMQDVQGQIEFSAVNGGVSLQRIAGKVHGQTVNGGLRIQLAGAQWEGEGLDVKTSNGGVDMAIPVNYSARLETSTVNGGLRLDYPVTVQGEIGRELTATLGSGGATIRAITTNGGVTIKRAGL